MICHILYEMLHSLYSQQYKLKVKKCTYTSIYIHIHLELKIYLHYLTILIALLCNIMKMLKMKLKI